MICGAEIHGTESPAAPRRLQAAVQGRIVRRTDQSHFSICEARLEAAVGHLRCGAALAIHDSRLPYDDHDGHVQEVACTHARPFGTRGVAWARDSCQVSTHPGGRVCAPAPRPAAVAVAPRARAAGTNLPFTIHRMNILD